MALIECPDCGQEISDQAAACIKCGRPMHLAAPEPGIKSPSKPKPINPAAAFVGLCLIAIAVVVLFSNGDGDKKAAPTTPLSTTDAVPTSNATASGESSDSPASAATAEISPPLPATLPDAINVYMPLMTDESNSLSQGAALLAMWESGKNIPWGALVSLPRTKADLVLKDSSQERGKLICTNGQIVEIAAEDTPAGKVFDGEIADEDGNGIFRFIAARSTGNLVQGSHASFCGVVIGKFDYSNSMDGVTHAIQLVGMFDLPENRH